MAAVSSSFFIMVLVVVLRSNHRSMTGAASDELARKKNSYSLELKLVSEIKRGNDKIQENFFKVKTLYDPTIDRHLYLFNPIIVRLQMTSVILAYPLSFVHLVNNRPYNLILANQHECHAPGLTTVCGKRRGHSKNQGFCCPNVLEAHCFMYDPVWYSVNSIDRPLLLQVLGIQIYEEQFSVNTRNLQWKIIAEASTLLTSDKTPPQLVVKENYYLSAKMLNISKVGNGTCKSCLDYGTNYLLIPTLSASVEKGTPQYDQINSGASKYLVINRNLLDIEGHTCGTVGLTEEAFITNKYQCKENFVDKCLQNQPMELWYRDAQSTDQSRQLVNGTRYYLSNFVKLFHPYVSYIPSCNDHMLLLVESLRSDMAAKMEVSLVLDDTIEIKKAASILTSVGKIGTIYTCPLVDGAKEHEIGINVLNSGILSGKYNLLLKCNLDEQSKTIILAPYESKTILFYQRTAFVEWPDEIVGRPIVGNSMNGEKTRVTPFIKCRLKLWSNEEKNQSFKTFYLEKDKICICLEGCKCACGPDYKCETLETHKKVKHIRTKINWLMLILGILCLILLLNLLKVIFGLCFPKHIGEAGLGLFIRGNWLDKYFEDDLKYKYVQYDENGYPVDPDTGKRVRGLSRLKMSLINLGFLFYLPFIGIHWIVKVNEMKNREEKEKLKDSYETEDIMSLTSMCESDDVSHLQQDISKYVTEETTLLDDVKQEPKYYVSTLTVDVDRYADQQEMDMKDVDLTEEGAKEGEEGEGGEGEEGGEREEGKGKGAETGEGEEEEGKEEEEEEETEGETEGAKSCEDSDCPFGEHELVDEDGEKIEHTHEKADDKIPDIPTILVDEIDENEVVLDIVDGEKQLNTNASNIGAGQSSDKGNISVSGGKKIASNVQSSARKGLKKSNKKAPNSEGPGRKAVTIDESNRVSMLDINKHLSAETEEKWRKAYGNNERGQAKEKQHTRETVVRFALSVDQPTTTTASQATTSQATTKGGKTNPKTSSSTPSSGLKGGSNTSASKERILTKLQKSNPVYCNYQSTSPFLKNTGKCFSLCGNIEKRENVYVFRLGSYLKQTYEVIEDSVRALKSGSLLISQAHRFVKVMDAEDALQCITEKPKYPCLNMPSKTLKINH